MRPNPVSFLLLSMVLGMMVMVLVFIGLLTIDINIERDYSRSVYDAKGISYLSVDNTLGKVEVHGSDRKDIEIEIRKETYFGKDTLDRIDVDIKSGEGLVIKVDTEIDFLLYTVEIDVWIPQNLTVQYVRLDFGLVRIDQISQLEKVSIGSGEIIMGTIGSIGLIDVDNGHVEVEYASNLTEARMDNGDMDLTLGSLGANGTRIEGDNGDIIIRLPQNLSFDFDLKVDSGDIALKNLGVRYDRDRQFHKEGSVIDGGPELFMRLDSGSITIYGEVI